MTPTKQTKREAGQLATLEMAQQVISVMQTKQSTKQTKHTPGPWTIEKGLYGEVGEFTIWGSEKPSGASPLVATISSNESKANARLIAAAPSLAEVLQLLLNCPDYAVRDENGFPVPSQQLEDVLTLAQEALTKAGLL